MINTVDHSYVVVDIVQSCKYQQFLRLFLDYQSGTEDLCIAPQRESEISILDLSMLSLSLVP